jgi:hypothetical protein
MPKQAAWQSAEFRTDANDRAADKAFRAAMKERNALPKDWTRAMTAAHYGDALHMTEADKQRSLDHAKRLQGKSDEVEKIITAARAYAQLPKR